MATIALAGLVPAVADLVAVALRGEGHAVTRLPLDADVVRALGRAPPDVLVLDGHAYANVRALLTDLRAQAATASLPVVTVTSRDRPLGATFIRVRSTKSTHSTEGAMPRAGR